MRNEYRTVKKLSPDKNKAAIKRFLLSGMLFIVAIIIAVYSALMFILEHVVSQ